MDAHIKKVYVPMTETGFYILLCLRSPNHGYGVVQKVREMTDNEVEVKLAEHGKEIGSLKHRMKEAEDVVNVVHQLAQEMVGLTKEVGFMNQTLVQLTAKVTHLEQTPAKRWDGVVTALIGAVIGGIVAMYL